MNLRKHIPNAITCLNLVSGCIAIVYALQGNLLSALVWIIVAAVLDFFDGFAARLLKAYSPVGKDLDSLADVVSFGVAPGMMVFYLIGATVGYLLPGPALKYLPCFAFIIPAISGVRLAKFNNDPRQSDSFIGLNVPSHALLWASAVYSLFPLSSEYPLVFLIATITASFLTSLLLISEIPMFSLKIKSLKWKGNENRYILAVCAILFLIFFGALGIAGTIILYILLSIFNKKNRRDYYLCKSKK